MVGSNEVLNKGIDMAKLSEGEIIDKLIELKDSLSQKWEPEVFFSTLMTIYGTAQSSISEALKGNPAINVASDVEDPSLLHKDLAIKNRAYFRFLKEDTNVRESLDLLVESEAFNRQSSKLQFAICAGPNLISIFDKIDKTYNTFELKELPNNYNLLLPLTTGYKRFVATDGTEADVRACTKLTKLLYDLAKLNNIDLLREREREHNFKSQGHALNEFIRRILFCLFAEDTGIFKYDSQGNLNHENRFTKALSTLTNQHGTNTKQFFEDLFEVLNTPLNERKNIKRPISQVILDFPYVNGGLFAGEHFIPEFNTTTRAELLDLGKMAWHEISPAIFGSMFQNALDPKTRREMGAHYTSEANILKIINPLFMDSLRDEFEKIKSLPTGEDENNTRLKSRLAKARQEALMAFQNKLVSLKFLDPACGCGNFLIIAYRELRRLENQVLEELFSQRGWILEVGEAIKVNINQFYGIEIEDWPSEIAHLSMWLMQHVMNQETSQKFGVDIPSIPLKTSATIVCTNALTCDWQEILPASECSYILGNPPFGGTTYTTSEQKAWLKAVYPPKYTLALADFCTAWFVKASSYMQENKTIRAALVATNSICQGQQVNTLWGLLLNKGVHINFAWTSFMWSNEASNKAAVTCIIVGFSYHKDLLNKIYSVREDGSIAVINTPNISPYLLPSQKSVIVKAQSKALSAKLNLKFGNKPCDGGNLLLSPPEYQKVISKDPLLKPFIKYFRGSDELINGTYRYCLWLKEEDKALWEKIPFIKNRVEACYNFRANATITGDAFKLKDKPWSFREQFNPHYALIIPAVSSERRFYVPMDFIDNDTIISNRCFILPEAQPYDFGILVSRMHMCWMRLTCGRLKTDYNYSRDLVYNTFIWPTTNPEQEKLISDLAEKIIMIRDNHLIADDPIPTLATLYNPESMPADLKEAHQRLDIEVEKLYREEPFEDDDERTVFMLDLYAQKVQEVKE